MLAGVQSRLSVLFVALGFAGIASAAAPFGTVVPISGSAADIALDEARGRLYVANFGADRIEVINTVSQSLMTSFPVPAPPSAVAVSPNSQFLVVGEYEKPIISSVGGFQPNTGGLDTYDINTGNSRHLDLPCPVLTVSFGSDGLALVVCRNPPQPPPPPPPAEPPPVVPQPNIFLLNPVTNSLQTIGTVPVQRRQTSRFHSRPPPVKLSRPLLVFRAT